MNIKPTTPNKLTVRPGAGDVPTAEDFAHWGRETARGILQRAKDVGFSEGLAIELHSMAVHARRNFRDEGFGDAECRAYVDAIGEELKVQAEAEAAGLQPLPPSGMNRAMRRAWGKRNR